MRKIVVPRSFVEPTDLVPDGGATRRIETGRRLVEEQHLGLVHERRGEVETSLHPAGVGADAAIDRIADVDEHEQVTRSVGVRSAALSP